MDRAQNEALDAVRSDSALQKSRDGSRGLIKALHLDIAAADKALHRYEERITELEHQVSEATERAEANFQKGCEQGARIAALEAEKAALADKARRFTLKAHDQNGELYTLRSQVAALEKERDSLRHRIATDSLAGTCIELEAELHTLRERVRVLEEEREKLLNDCAVWNVEARRCSSELTEMRRAYEYDGKRLFIYMSRVSALEAMLNEWVKPCFCNDKGSCLMCETRTLLSNQVDITPAALLAPDLSTSEEGKAECLHDYQFEQSASGNESAYVCVKCGLTKEEGA